RTLCIPRFDALMTYGHVSQNGTLAVAESAQNEPRPLVTKAAPRLRRADLRRAGGPVPRRGLCADAACHDFFARLRDRARRLAGRPGIGALEARVTRWR